MRKAEQAIQQNNDDAARNALTRHNDNLKQAQRYAQQQQEQEQLVTTLRSALRQLEAKISEVDTTIELLVARRRNAVLQQRVFDALNKTGGAKDKERATRAQDAVMEAEARARALAELHKRDLDVQLEQLSQEQVVEEQLNELKAKRQFSRETPLLHEGNAHLSSLIPPQPQRGEPSRKRANHKPEQPEPASPSPQAPTTGELDIAQLKKLMEQ